MPELVYKCEDCDYTSYIVQDVCPYCNTPLYVHEEPTDEEELINVETFQKMVKQRKELV